MGSTIYPQPQSGGARVIRVQNPGCEGWVAPSWELIAGSLDKGPCLPLWAGAMPSLARGLATVLKPSQQRARGWPLHKDLSLGAPGALSLLKRKSYTHGRQYNSCACLVDKPTREGSQEEAYRLGWHQTPAPPNSAERTGVSKHYPHLSQDPELGNVVKLSHRGAGSIYPALPGAEPHWGTRTTKASLTSES